MSTEGLARFDTRTRTRTAPTDEHSQQTDLRTIGVREHGQLALNELDSENRTIIENQTSADTRRSEEPTRADLEAALGCARTTIDGLREQIEELEAKHDRLRKETKAESD